MGRLAPHPDGYPIKLVFDETPNIINRSGEPGELFYSEVAPHERKHWLRLKLAEEVAEYLVGGEYVELADVLAVVEALAHEHGGSLGGLAEVAHADRRGGLRRGVMMYGRHPEFDSEPS